MIKYKKYWYIISSIVLMVVFAIFKFTNAKNDSLDKTTGNYQNVSLLNSEKNNFKKKQKPSIKKSKKTGIDKHEHFKSDNKEQMTDDFSIPEELPFPNEFSSMKEGVSIVSFEDQPIPDEFKTATRRVQQQMEEQGYTDASEDDVNHVSNYLSPQSQKYLQSHEEAADSFISETIDIEGTPFDGKKMIGAMGGGVEKDGQWTGLTRLYEFEDLGVVKLDEDDHIAAGSRIQLTKELINENINGNPAIYTVQVSSSDKALTKITWATESKKYSLSMNKNASKDEILKEDFIDLARSLPTETGSFDNHTNDSSGSIAVEPPTPPL
jgi:hypothetical protein